MSSRVVSELLLSWTWEATPDNPHRRAEFSSPYRSLYLPSVFVLLCHVRLGGSLGQLSPCPDYAEKVPRDLVLSPHDTQITQASLVLPQSTCHT
jgi:hypothetical protein